MNSKFLACATLLAVLSGVATAADDKPDLKCNVCFTTAGVKPNCEILSCNSILDVKKAYVSLTRQQTGIVPSTDALILPESVTKDEQNQKFVCVQSVAKYKGAPSKAIAQTCSLLNPKFPPSDKPYQSRDFALDGITDSQGQTKAEKFFLDRLKSLQGDTYVCDDTLGLGINCGENSILKLDEVEGTAGRSFRGRLRHRGRGGRRHFRHGRPPKATVRLDNE